MPLYCQNFVFWLPFWLNNSYRIPLFLFLLVCFGCMLFIPPPFTTRSHPLPSCTAYLPDCFCYLQHGASLLNFSDRLLLWVCWSSFVELIYIVPHWNPFLLIWEISRCPVTLFVQYNPPLYQSNKSCHLSWTGFCPMVLTGFFSLKRWIWIVLYFLVITDGYFLPVSVYLAHVCFPPHPCSAGLLQTCLCLGLAEAVTERWESLCSSNWEQEELLHSVKGDRLWFAVVFL